MLRVHSGLGQCISKSQGVDDLLIKYPGLLAAEQANLELSFCCIRCFHQVIILPSLIVFSVVVNLMEKTKYLLLG